MTDHNALQAMVRFAHREALQLRMNFTAYLLNLAAESLKEQTIQAGDVVADDTRKQNGDELRKVGSGKLSREGQLQ